MSYSENLCIGCEECTTACPTGAIDIKRNKAVIDRQICETSGDCAKVCPTGALEMVGNEMTTGEVLKEIEKDKVFYDVSSGGVTFSGGEPLMQWEFVYEVAKACQDKGIHTTLDTSGHVKWEVIDQIRTVTDLFLYDLKHLDDDRHRLLTGVSNRMILENLEKLAYLKEKLFIRIPVIPGINDDEGHLRSLCKWVASIGIREVMLIPYHRIGMDKYSRIGKTYSMTDVPEPSDEDMKKIGQVFRKQGITVKPGFDSLRHEPAT